MDIRMLRRRVVTTTVVAACALGPVLAATPVFAATTVQVTASGAISNLTPPTISGSPTIGSVLTADPGTWDAADATFGYQWQAGSVDIPGATGPTFTLTYLQSAQPVTVVVTATSSDGSASATSAVLFVPPGTPGNLTAPSISGTPAVGQTLTADPGTWDVPDLTFSYRWQRAGSDIPGADAATYSVGALDVGHALTVVVTAGRDSFNTATSTSAPLDVPATGAPINVVPPRIRTWPVEVESPVTADPGVWNVDSATFSYQWRSEGTDIPGATEQTFTPPAGMVGEQLTVAVTASAGGYTSDPVVSDPFTIDQRSVRSLTLPVISGDPRPGQTLTADPGTYDVPGATQTYQWYVDAAPVPGATSTTYVVRAGDVGLRVQFSVAVQADGYYPTQAFTDEITVKRGTVTLRSAPRITGTALVGHTLSATPGTWSVAGIPLSHQWTVDGRKVAAGSTFVVPASAAGKRIGVIETTGGPAYVPASQSSATVVAHAPSTVKVTLTKPGRGKVKVTVTVTAVPATVPVTGAVTVKVSRATRTVTLRGGRASVTVRGVKKGKVLVKAKYAGSITVAPGSGSRSTHVK